MKSSPATSSIRVISLFVDEGVSEVRFTGGEPLLRPDLEADHRRRRWSS